MTFSMKKVKEMKHMKFGDRPSIGRRGYAAPGVTAKVESQELLIDRCGSWLSTFAVTPAAAGGRQIDGRSFMSFMAFMIFTSSPCAAEPLFL